VKALSDLPTPGKSGVERKGVVPKLSVAILQTSEGDRARRSPRESSVRREPREETGRMGV
jgi:hypothetical protein